MTHATLVTAWCHADLKILAAAHPQLYFGLVDCCSRCSVRIADAAPVCFPLDSSVEAMQQTMSRAVEALYQGVSQSQQVMLQLLERPAAVASMVSAVAGIVKCWAYAIKGGRGPAPASTAYEAKEGKGASEQIQQHQQCREAADCSVKRCQVQQSMKHATALANWVLLPLCSSALQAAALLLAAARQ
jgi:hypothetical protein